MAHIITLARPFTGVVAGVEFAGGVGQADLGPNLVEYFTLRGAVVEPETESATAPALEDLTLEQLHAVALEAGLTPDPKWKSKRAFVDAIRSHVADQQPEE